MDALGDDGGEVTSRRSSEALSEAGADALLSGRAAAGHDDLREIVGLMRTASAVPAPPPTAALAAVLHHGFDPLPVEPTPRAGRWGCWSARIVVATAAAVLGTLGAATANALPAPVQTAVADVVGAVTPLELPRPSADARTGSGDHGEPSDGPSPVPSEQPDGTAQTGAEARSGEPADSTPVRPETPPPLPKAPVVVTPPLPKAPAVVTPPLPKAPAVVIPPRRPEAPAPATDEPDAYDPDTDVPGSDEVDAEAPEQPEPGGTDGDVQEGDEPEPPEQGEADQGDPDDRDLPEPGEPEPWADEPDAEA